MKTRNLLLTALFVALLIVSSYIVIPIGPVPHTLQPFVALLTGYLLGPAYGSGAVLVWILMGILGLPVFHLGQGGIVVLLGPTGGFILGFVCVAYLVGSFRQKTDTFSKTMALMLGAVIILYVIGLCGFKFNMEHFLEKNLDWQKSFYLSVAPFLPFDIIKAVLAAYLGSRIKKALDAAGLTLPNKI